MSDKPSDPAEGVVSSRNAKRLQGWTIQEWLDFIQRNPECTLPGGVGSAIVRYLTPNFPKTALIEVSEEFLGMLGNGWSVPIRVKIHEEDTTGRLLMICKTHDCLAEVHLQ